MVVRKYWQIVAIFFLWLFASFPLFGNRFIPTHDGEYHLIRIYEFSKVLASGNLFPRWAPELNSRYGFPLFIFHYPFPNYVGSFFHIFGFPLVQSFHMSLALGMFVAAIGCYFFLKKEFLDKFPAFIGAVIFLTIPYLYVDVYIRGSIGEIWGIAWAFAALASMVWGKPIFLAVSIGLLIISHNIMAMLMIPMFFGYSFFFYRDRLKYILLGILTASYFWIPALLESKFVVGLNSVTYSDHFPDLTQLLFPSWGSNFSQPGLANNEMSQQIGVIPLIIIFITVIKIIKIINQRKKVSESHKIFYFFGVTVLSIFFMFSFSDPLWKLFSFLQYIQYPWRLLSVLFVTVPFLGAIVVKNARPIFGWGLIILSILFSFSYMQPVTYEPRNDEYYLTKREFTDGTSSMGNSFTTVWTPWKKERPLSRVEVIQGNASVFALTSTTLSDTFTIASEGMSVIRVNRLYYPGWVVRVNGNNIPVEYMKEGIITFPVSSGTHNVVVSFGSTPTRTIANSISLVSLGILIYAILKKHYAYRN